MAVHHVQLLPFLILSFILSAELTHASSAFVSAMYSSTTADTHIASLYTVGCSAPIQSGTNAFSYSVVVTGFNPTSASYFFSSVSGQANGVAIFGPSGANIVQNVYIGSFTINTTPMYSPLAQTLNYGNGGGYYCYFNSRVYWLLPSDQAQAVGVMVYLSQRALVPTTQIALAYTNNGVSILSTQTLKAIATVLGISGLSVQSSGGQSYTSAAYASVFATAPGVVYQLLEASQTYPSQWIKAMISDEKFITANTTIGTTLVFDYMTLQAYNEKAATGTVLPPQNMITGYPIPGVGSTEYQASQDFLLAESTSIASLSTTSEKNFVMAGWVAGWAMIQALTMLMGASIDKSSFYNTLNTAQLMNLVSDLFYGSMGDSCSAIALSQGAICSCRWSGNNVWFHTLSKFGNTFDSTPIHGALFQYAQGACANICSTPLSSQMQLPRTVHVVGFSPTDNDVVSYVCSQTLSTIDAVSNTTLFWHHSSHAYRGYCLPTAMSSASSDFSTHQSTYVTTTLMGVIPDAVVTASTPPSTLILDFMPQTTQLHVSKDNFVYLFPTLEQELYVLAMYLSGVATSTSVVCAVVSFSTYSAAITALLTKTLNTFGITPSSENVNQPSGALSSSISASCTHTFVIGTASSDATGILGVMQQESTSIVLMSFEDLTKQYAAFASAFGSAGTAVTDRLVFATNLPMWTGSTMSSGTLSSASALSTVGEFVDTLSPAAQTPAAVRAFIVAMLYDQLTIGTSWGQPDMQAALYGNGTVHVGGMTFGPFLQSWGTQGLRNFGARDISVWSYTRVVLSSRVPLLDSVNPSLVYRNAVDLVASAVEVVSYPIVDDDVCVKLQESSSLMEGAESTTASHQDDSTTVGPSASPVSSLGSTSSSFSSSLHAQLKLLLYALVTMLAVLIIYIAVLLLVFFNCHRRLRNLALSWRCWWRCCGDSGCLTKAANDVRATIHEECTVVPTSEREVNGVCGASEANPSRLRTVVYVEVEKWRPLWVRQPEAMSAAMRHFECCVLRAAHDQNVQVAQVVEGMRLFTCSSPDAGISFARDMIKGVTQLQTRNSLVLNEEYARLGCGESLVERLRLRVAINAGPATVSLGASGKVVVRGRAVDGAVEAACTAGASGLIVLTSATLSGCSGTEKDLNVHCVGSMHSDKNNVLYALSVLPSVAEETTGRACYDPAEYAATLHFLCMTSDNSRTGLRLWCIEQLENHYAIISEEERIADLRCMAELFSLSETLLENHQSAHDKYTHLLRGVGQHVASMMECRHGVPRGSCPISPPQRSSAADASSHMDAGECVNLLKWRGVTSKSSLREVRLRQRSAQLRHFAYSSCDDDEEV